MRWENRPPPLAVQPLERLAATLAASPPAAAQGGPAAADKLPATPHGYWLPGHPSGKAHGYALPGHPPGEAGGELAEPAVRVFVPVALEAVVMAHLAASLDEQGGLLVGELFGEPALGAQGVAAIVLSQAIPAREHAASAVALRMEAPVWNAARDALGERGAIVGWYHSHPGLTAFFSATDRATQRAFFPHPYSLGWVIDPLLDDEAWFLGAASAALAADRIARWPLHGESAFAWAHDPPDG